MYKILDFRRLLNYANGTYNLRVNSHLDCNRNRIFMILSTFIQIARKWSINGLKAYIHFTSLNKEMKEKSKKYLFYVKLV